MQQLKSNFGRRIAPLGGFYCEATAVNVELAGELRHSGGQTAARLNPKSKSQSKFGRPTALFLSLRHSKQERRGKHRVCWVGGKNGNVEVKESS